MAGKAEHEATKMDSILNNDVLSQLKKDMGPVLTLKIINIFLEEAAERSADIVVAAKNKEIARLKHQAHSLKSSSATFGASLLQKISQQLELVCKINGNEDALRLAKTLESGFETTRSAFAHYFVTGG